MNRMRIASDIFDTMPTLLKKSMAGVVAAATTLSAATAFAAPSIAETSSSADWTASNFVEAFAQTLLEPQKMPTGVNDWNCALTEDHPNPVVLIHGTWENAYDNWAALAPELKADGYCVFAANHGAANLLNKGGALSVLPNTFGTGDIAASAGEIATFVDQVRNATGAEKVDLVGHSQGGLLARQYLKFNGGANPENPAQNKVDKLITLGATNHGTTLSGIGSLDRFIGRLGVNLDPLLDHVVGEAGTQQVYNSPLLTELNKDGDTMPGISYTTVGTKYDEITTPYVSTALTAGPDATVDNILVQDNCVIDHSDHLSMSYSPRVADIVRNVLSSGKMTNIRCTPNSPIMGTGSVEISELLTGPFGWLSENARQF